MALLQYTSSLLSGSWFYYQWCHKYYRGTASIPLVLNYYMWGLFRQWLCIPMCVHFICSYCWHWERDSSGTTKRDKNWSNCQCKSHIVLIPFDDYCLFHQIVPPFDQDVRSTFTESFIKEGVMARGNGMQTLKSMNVMMQQNSSNASVIFTALPPLPVNICDAASYIENLNALSSEC